MLRSAASEFASARGYFLLLSNMHPESPGGGTAVLRALRGRVDGLLLMAPHVADRELVEALPGGLPTLLINTRGEHGKSYSAISIPKWYSNIRPIHHNQVKRISGR